MGVKTLMLFFLAGLGLLECSVAFGNGNDELTSIGSDLGKHRSKRWLWGGCGLIPSCDRCSDGLVCKQCSRVYLPVEYVRSSTRMIRCARVCPAGYNISSTRDYAKICVRVQLGCEARNCDDCHPDNPVSCINCSRGFYSLQKRIMGVIRCVRQCPAGYTANTRSDGTKICRDNPRKCQSLVPNCAKCLDGQRCRKCRNDFIAYINKTNMVCVRTCPQGLAAASSGFFGKYCKKPLVVCSAVRNCERCPDKINCRRCKPGYFKLKLSAFSNSTCVSLCPLGFVRKGKRCQRVLEDGCYDEFCLTCKVGWYRLNHNKKHCLRHCPSGYYPLGDKQKFCLKCLEDCDNCINGQSCIKCKLGTAKIVQASYNTSCVQTCPIGYRSQSDDKTGKVCLPLRIT